jgi:hypothetical protein
MIEKTEDNDGKFAKPTKEGEEIIIGKQMCSTIKLLIAFRCGA